MLATYTIKGVTPELNLREHASAKCNKAAHSDFETQRRRHQKSETGVSVGPKMDMFQPKILKEKEKFTFP